MFRIKGKHFLRIVLEIGIAVGILAFCLPATGRADAFNEKTYVTFSGPVQIPGQVLSAGTYIFELGMPNVTNDIVQIWNKDHSHLYATLVAEPDYHMRARGKTVIKLERLGPQNPEALKSWFYPGDNYGDLFVYPKARAIEAARLRRQSAPAAAAEPRATTNG